MIDEDPIPDDVLDARKAFEEERRKGIFSTDTAAILGLSRYGSAVSVYRAKIGEAPERGLSLPAWIGLRLENLVAEMYAHATGNRVRADNQARFHPEYGWLGAHLDRRVVGDPGLVVELKTRGSTRGWGEDGSADVPVDVWTQVQHQAFVVGAREVHVAALFSNSSFRVYRIVPDLDTFREQIVPDLERFWFGNVVAGVPPLLTGADVDTDLVRALGGGDSGFIRPATPEQEQVIANYKIARFNRAQAEHAEQGLRNIICHDFIGADADGISGPFGTITWKRTADWTKYDWKAIAADLHKAADQLASMGREAMGDDHPRLPELMLVADTLAVLDDLHSEVRPGVRRIWHDFVEN